MRRHTRWDVEARRRHGGKGWAFCPCREMAFSMARVHAQERRSYAKGAQSERVADGCSAEVIKLSIRHHVKADKRLRAAVEHARRDLEVHFT